MSRRSGKGDVRGRFASCGARYGVGAARPTRAGPGSNGRVGRHRRTTKRRRHPCASNKHRARMRDRSAVVRACVTRLFGKLKLGGLLSVNARDVHPSTDARHPLRARPSPLPVDGSPSSLPAGTADERYVAEALACHPASALRKAIARAGGWLLASSALHSALCGCAERSLASIWQASKRVSDRTGEQRADRHRALSSIRTRVGRSGRARAFAGRPLRQPALGDQGHLHGFENWEWRCPASPSLSRRGGDDVTSLVMARPRRRSRGQITPRRGRRPARPHAPFGASATTPRRSRHPRSRAQYRPRTR